MAKKVTFMYGIRADQQWTQKQVQMSMDLKQTFIKILVIEACALEVAKKELNRD